MLDDIYKIGLLKCKKKDSVMEESIIPDKVTGIAKVLFIRVDEKYQFVDVMPYEFNEKDQYQYLLRKNSANGINFGPTSSLVEPEKTLEKKIIAWFKNVGKEEENKFAITIATELEKNKEEISKQIAKMIIKKEKYLLSIMINGKAPYQIEWIFKAYEKLVKSKVFGEELQIGNCYLCQKKQVAIVPEYGVFKFYTKDKPGFIAGGFQEENFWRNCPVCVDCQPVLNIAKQYLEENLKFQYYDSSMKFYIIPSTIGSNNGLEEILNILSNSNKKIKMQKEAKEKFELDNESILYTLKDENNINSFRLVFIQKVQSSERILLDIKDLYPNRFGEMYLAKEKIDTIYQSIMQYTNKEKQIVSLKFNFSFFREFLSKSDNRNADNDLNKIFLELTDDILNQNSVDTKMLLLHDMREIRRLVDIDDKGKFKFTVLKAVAGIQYLELINCIKVKEESRMKTKYTEFFEQYNCGLNTDIKKALVLVGALVQKVMNIQYTQIKSTPFSKNLKSLRLREQDVKSIIAQAINKMQEYNSYSYQSREIVEEISKLIFSSEDTWKLSVDEINFYIAAGMALQKEIYGKEELIEEGNENNE